ncbi:histone H1-I-like [Musca vetustissima]|uniref:histone H1-I-like n=1 Tax=Musca vetustissima TaxID=27455 RepID=UPI002AB7C39F|nr:histone H1-I-like [Musca vetustissima]
MVSSNPDPDNNHDAEERIQSPFVPITPKDSLSAMDSEPPISPPKKPMPRKIAPLPTRKTIPTKTMVMEALKTITKLDEPQPDPLSRQRKTLSLRGIQKFMALKYFVTKPDMKSRMPYVKKYVRDLLAKGQLKSVKPGAGITGSFWVPAKSELKKELRSKPKRRGSKPKKSLARKQKGGRKVRRGGGKMRMSGHN